MKKFRRLSVIVALGSALAAPQLAQAEARWSVGGGAGLSAHAKLKLKVIVPRIVILKVGDLGATVNEITWDATGTTATDAIYSGNIPPTSSTLPFAVSDDESASNGGGAIAVQVFGNAGDVSLTAVTTTPGVLTDGNTNYTIPLSDFSVASSTSTPHPLLDGPGVIITASSGIVNPGADTWTYSYTPSTTPAAGTYTTTITYTAANP